MDPRYCAQDIIRCDHCEEDIVQSHCELCHTNLCIVCVGKHLSNSLKKHNVVPYKQKSSTPIYNYQQCPLHVKRHCELYCDRCDIPVCSTCISSGQHQGHNLSDVLDKINSEKEKLEKELNELEQRIYPMYTEIVTDMQDEKSRLVNHFEELRAAVNKQREIWHREIETVMNKRISEIEELKTKYIATLNEREDEIAQTISDVKSSILDLQKLLDSNDVSLPLEYKSRNVEFRRVPPKITIVLPNFISKMIDTDLVCKLFGSLSASSITTEDRCYEMNLAQNAASLPVKQLLDEPEVITTINTRYKYLQGMTCLSDEMIWTCGENKLMRLFNSQGELQQTVQSKSGSMPRDIAVTTNGDLIYTDEKAKTVNMVKKKQVQVLIRLHGWTPYNVCGSSSGDILVTLCSDDDEQSKVVRYSGPTEKQSIQFDDESMPLYSSGCLKYIDENRNLDICVADWEACAVIVVDQAGKLRFKYSGHPSASKGSFQPYGITTDSQSQILTTDCDNQRIHILDKDGHFLRYIENCDLHDPWSLCVDTRDNLFVAESSRSKVKKIKYMYP